MRCIYFVSPIKYDVSLTTTKGQTMSKEVQMAIKMEPELRDSFHAVAKLQHRPAAQVIRDFMRQYIAENGDPAQAKAAPAPAVQPS
jgi:predicted DNA-binding protein